MRTAGFATNSTALHADLRTSVQLGGGSFINRCPPLRDFDGRSHGHHARLGHARTQRRKGDTTTMSGSTGFQQFQSDGPDRSARPLTMLDQMLAQSVAGGQVLALLLRQANDEHECQWGLTGEQADRLIDMLQQAR